MFQPALRYLRGYSFIGDITAWFWITSEQVISMIYIHGWEVVVSSWINTVVAADQHSANLIGFEGVVCVCVGGGGGGWGGEGKG